MNPRWSFLTLATVLLALTGCETTRQSSDEQALAAARANRDPQHDAIYFVQHRALPGYFFNSEQFLLDMVHQGDAVIQSIWADEVKTGDEAAITVEIEREEETTLFIFITFPAPPDSPLCYAVALIAQAEGDRQYITLEKAEDLGYGFPAFVCAWTKEGTHLNFGPTTTIDLEAFKQFVRQKVEGIEPPVQASTTFPQ